MSSLGIPVKLLHEAQGHIVTVELKTGELYRGTLTQSEDNMNVHISNIVYTAKDGKLSELETAFIRGSKIRFIILPDILKNAPMFRRSEKERTGRGMAFGGSLPRGSGSRGRAKKA